MSITTPEAPRPILVNAKPGREQLFAFARQLLIALGGFGLGVWVAKDTQLVPNLVALFHPLLAALSGATGVGAIVLGQFKTRLASQISARLANMLPDKEATTVPSAPLRVLPLPPTPAEPAPVVTPVHVIVTAATLSRRRAVPAWLMAYLVRVEGEKFTAYQDSRGRWTIGVGHTGSDVGPGVVWTQPMIDAALARDLLQAVARLEDAIDLPAIWALSQAQYGALLSFVYNVGEVSTWEVWVDIRDGDLSDVPYQLERFVYSNGVKVEGLVNRRADDVAVWNGTAPEVRLAA